MRRSSSDGGYISLAVLVVTGLLAVVVTSIVTISRPAVGLVRLGFDEVAADAIVEGGIQTAAFLLFQVQQDSSEVDGIEVQIGDGVARIAVADEGGRIDLNAADPELLAGLYTAAGGNTLRPAAFAARIADWRDSDDQLSEAGAEAQTYDRNGLGELPPNAPFRSVEDLRQVYGVSAEDFERVAPYLTVYNSAGGVDPLSADPIVLRAVPGLSRADIDRLISARAAMRDREALIALLGEPNSYLMPQPSGVYRVAVIGELANGFTQAVETVLIAAQETVSSGSSIGRRGGRPPPRSDSVNQAFCVMWHWWLP